MGIPKYNGARLNKHTIPGSYADQTEMHSDLLLHYLLKLKPTLSLV
jgi:hypothetical protein